MPVRKPGLLLTLTGLLAISCSVQEIDIKDPAALEGDVFYASLESYEPDTKVYLDENIKILWDAEDQISIFNKTSHNQQFKFLGETGENSGTFKKLADGDGPEEPLSYICAVYPYLKDTKINKEGVLTLTLPAEQAYRDGSFGIGANTMVSATEDNLLKFKNVGGYLVLKFYGEGVAVKSVKLEGNNGELLSGKAKTTPAVGAVPSIEMERTAGTSITLNCETPVELGAKKEDAVQFWMVVPPTNFSKGFKLTVTDSEGNEFVKETSANLTVARNGVLRIAAIRAMTKPVKYSKTSTLSEGGTYLIVDANDSKLFKGATDGSYLTVAPEGGVITDTDGSLAAFEFTVENDGDKYYLRFNDGKYLICDYTDNGRAGLAYVNTPSDMIYPYSLSIVNNGGFCFSTTQVNNTSYKDQVLYYREPGGNNTDIFKIGGTGRGVGVHLYMKGGKLDRGLSFNPEEVTCIFGETPQKPVLSGIYSTVTYSSSDTRIASVDADGNVTPYITGSVTITATVDEDDRYNAGSASYTLHIKRIKHTPQYVRVTSADQINTDGEYVIVYDDGMNPKVFKPVLNANKTAFMTTNNAVNVIIDDNEIEANEVDDYRILLTNRQDNKFALLVPEADGLNDYYLVVYMSSSIFVASTTESSYRTSFSLSPQGVLTMTGNSGNAFRYASGAFTAGGGNSENLYLFVRNQGPVKQRQYPYFAEGSVTWSLGDEYEIGGSYDPQPVIDAQTAVTYSAEPESVAKIVNGKIQIVGAGTATITATAAKSDSYFTASANYSLRIRNAADGWVDLGSFNLENDALTAYLNDAENSYTDTNDDTFTVMNKYSNYGNIDRRDCPAPVRITWSDAASNNTVISIYEDNSLGTPVWEQNASISTTSAEVYNLIPGRTYYYTVSENNDIWEKGSFSTTGRRRMLKVSNSKGRGYANNCRDLGGLEVVDKGVKKTIKYGLLFRGTNMDNTKQGVEWPILLDFMKIGRDIDLRNGTTTGNNFGSEGSYNRYRPLPQSIDYTAPGFMDGSNFQDLTVTDKVYEVVMAFFNTVKSGKSVYYHCYSGADRTGYFSMLIEGLLGVSEKDCTIDYELTSFCSSVGARYRTGGTNDYNFRDGIAFLRGKDGNTFQEKIENYLVNEVKISQADINEFKSLMLEKK
jgi:hypothetical protein